MANFSPVNFHLQSSPNPLFIGVLSLVNITFLFRHFQKSRLCALIDNCTFCAVIFFICLIKPVVDAIIALTAGFLSYFSVALASFGATKYPLSPRHGAGAAVKNKEQNNMKTKRQVLAFAGEIIGYLALAVLAAAWVVVGSFAID